MITLKNVLVVNALSSGVTGLLLVVMPQTVAGIFEVPQKEPFLATGIFLVLFALLVFYASSKKEVDRALVKFIIYLDMLWVVASLAIVVPQLFNLSLWGYLLITGVAVWVGLMAYLQHTGLKRASIEKVENRIKT